MINNQNIDLLRNPSLKIYPIEEPLGPPPLPINNQKMKLFVKPHTPPGSPPPLPPINTQSKFWSQSVKEQKKCSLPQKSKDKYLLINDICKDLMKIKLTKK